MKQIRVHLKQLPIAPRKVRAVCDIIRGMSLGDAEANLIFRKERSAGPILKLLRSAAASAKESGLNPDRMVVSTITVDKGMILRRILPRARGMATPLQKKRSHLTVVLTEGTKPSRFVLVRASLAKKATAKKAVKARPETGDEAAQKPEATQKPAFFKRVFRRKSV